MPPFGLHPNPLLIVVVVAVVVGIVYVVVRGVIGLFRRLREESGLSSRKYASGPLRRRCFPAAPSFSEWAG